MSTTGTTRRTQHQRRTSTISRLVDATISALIEVGYTSTSVKEICRRAEVSHGGLFRHFPARIDLMVAAAEEVARRQIAAFDERFAAEPGGGEPLITAMRLLRDACREPINTAWYELLLAARTDADLHARLRPATERYYAEIREVAGRIPGSDGFAPDVFATIVTTIVHLFDGEALVRAVHPMPELEEQRFELLSRLLRAGDQQVVSRPRA